MGNSIVLTGLDRRDEDGLRDALQGPVEPFFVLAQRILWGVSQADLIKVDVPRAASSLVRKYPRTPASHLVAAYAAHASDPGAAASALEQARRLAVPGHPLAYLMPSDEDWACRAKAPTLECVVPDRIWRIACHAPMGGSALLASNHATIIRDDKGELLIINPVPLSESVRAQIDSLGPVTRFAVQGKAHSRYVQVTADAFPDARSFGTEGHRTHQASAHLRFDDTLGVPGTSFHREFEEIRVDGFELAEVALLHKPTKLLILQDLLVGNMIPAEERPFLSKLYAFGFGVSKRVGFPAYQPMLWNDLPRMQECLKRLLAADYTSVAAAHWGPIQGDAVERELGTPLRWLSRLGKLEHKTMLFRFFMKQPGFLRDLLRYKRSQKRL